MSDILVENKAERRYRFPGWAISSSVILRFGILTALYIGAIKYLLEKGYVQILPDFIFLTLFSICLLGKKRHLVKGTKSLRVSIYLFIFIALLQILNPNIPSLVAGMEGFRKTAFYFIAFLIGIYMDWNDAEFSQLMKYILVLGIPLCLYSLKQYFAPSDFDRRMIETDYSGPWVSTVLGYTRARSIFPSPFILGYFGNIVAAISLFFYTMSKGRMRYLFFSLIGFSSVILSLTRINLVAAFVVVILSFVFYFKGRISKKVLLIVMLGGSFACLFLSSSKVRSYVSSLNPETIQEDRAWGRIRGWANTWTLIENNWFVGYGTGSAGDGLARYFDSTDSIVNTPHNMFFKVYFELGLVGLIVFSFILFKWISLNRLYRSKAAHDQQKFPYDLALTFFSILLVNGMTGGALDSFPANLLTFLVMGIFSKPIMIGK